MVVPETWKP